MSDIKRPLTPRQWAARRANAQKSTGPRTAAGKMRSALNSSKWRFCEQIFETVIGSRDEVREFRRLHRSLAWVMQGMSHYLWGSMDSEAVRRLATNWWRKLYTLRVRSNPRLPTPYRTPLSNLTWRWSSC